MTPSTARYGALSLAALLLATACTPPSTTSSLPPAFQAGQTLPITLLEGDTEVYRSTVAILNLEAPEARTRNAEGIENDLVALVQSEEFLDPAVAEGRGVVAPLVSEDAIVAFLDQHWDPAIGGAADPGRNAQEFLELVTDMGIDIPTFLAEFQKLGLPLSEYLKLIAFIDGYDDPHGNDGFQEFVQVLAWHGLTLKDFLLYVRDAGLTTAQVFEALRANNRSFGAFLAESADAETPLQDSLKALAGPSVQTRIHNQISQRPLIHTWYWNVITHNRVENEKAAVLSEEAWDLEAYTEGKLASAGKRSMIVGTRANPLVHVDWELSLRHDVRGLNGHPQGVFLRDIEVLFHKKHVSPGWKVNGTARVRRATYAGSASAPDAEVSVDLGFAINFLPKTWYLYHNYYYLSGTAGIRSTDQRGRMTIWDPLASSVWTILP
jgi:hypothetical protein